MHELGIVQEVVEIVSEKSGGASVTRLVLEIGRLTAVLPDAIRFCFELATEDTPLAGARLEIVETAGDELRIREMEVL
jgi:hydrogenase nickel incorporation protein HypA/HybF